MGLLTRPAAVALSPLWRRSIFPGAATRPPSVTPTAELVRDGVTLRGWVLNPGQERVLLYFGGNGERVEDNLADLARWFPEHTVHLLAYRGYGASDGRPSQAALVGDAVALLDREAAGAADVTVMGRSLGSGVAVQLAVRRPVSRLVLVTPFDSIVRVAADLVPLVPPWLPVADRFDSAAVVARLRCPVLVLRAAEDEVVRPPRTAALVRALREHSVDLEEVVVPGTGHNDLHLHPSYAAALGRLA